MQSYAYIVHFFMRIYALHTPLFRICALNLQHKNIHFHYILICQIRFPRPGEIDNDLNDKMQLNLQRNSEVNIAIKIRRTSQISSAERGL